MASVTRRMLYSRRKYALTSWIGSTFRGREKSVACAGIQRVVTKNFCVLHNEVEHNYISSSITLGLQLHVSALYVGHLQVVT